MVRRKEGEGDFQHIDTSQDEADMEQRHESMRSREGVSLPRRVSADTQAAGEEGVGGQLATAALVGLGVAALEIELIPGLLLGVGAMLAPKLMPALGNVVRPMAKMAVRVGYDVVSQAQSMIAEAGEQVQDMVAEVKAEERERHQHSHQQTHVSPNRATQSESAQSPSHGTP